MCALCTFLPLFLPHSEPTIEPNRPGFTSPPDCSIDDLAVAFAAVEVDSAFGASVVLVDANTALLLCGSVTARECIGGWAKPKDDSDDRFEDDAAED